MIIEKIAICKKNDANVKNAIAKRSSKLNQPDYSDTKRKRSTCPPWTKSLANAIVTMVFRENDVTQTISIELSLRVATPLLFVLGLQAVIPIMGSTILRPATGYRWAEFGSQVSTISLRIKCR